MQEGTPKGVLIPYIDGLRELASLKPDFIVMVCNTLHLFREALQHQVPVPILDLKAEVERELRTRNIKTVLVLGTPQTVNMNLYNFEGITGLRPNRTELGEIADIIRRFNSGVKTEKDRTALGTLCKRYLDSGAEAAILGCTELAVMLKEIKLPKIDTIDVLVGAVLDRIE